MLNQFSNDSAIPLDINKAKQTLKHDAPKLTDFDDNIMIQINDVDHVFDLGLVQSIGCTALQRLTQ
jgi:hypothetical protein